MDCGHGQSQTVDDDDATDQEQLPAIHKKTMRRTMLLCGLAAVLSGASAYGKDFEGQSRRR